MSVEVRLCEDCGAAHTRQRSDVCVSCAGRRYRERSGRYKTAFVGPKRIVRSETDRDQSIDLEELCRTYVEREVVPDAWWVTIRGWDGVYRQMYVGPPGIEYSDGQLIG